MKQLSILSLFILISIISIPGQTIEESGWIGSNTVWNVDTVKITGNILVSSGITLDIEPGTFIEFQDYYDLRISGYIKAIGAPGDSIIFTVKDTLGASNPGIPDGKWQRILFQGGDKNDSSVFRYCHLSYAHIASIDISGHHNVRIENCHFDYNFRSSGSGGAINAAGRGNQVTINNNLIENNYSYRGGGIYCQYTVNLELKNNIIKNNHATFTAGAVFLNQVNGANINNNLIVGNTSDQGTGGFYCIGEGIEFSRNEIHNNISIGVLGTGGLSCSGIYNSQIVNNLIYNNKGGYGGGMYCSDATCDITNNIIVNNEGTYGGGIHFVTSQLNLIGNTICNNHATITGGGITSRYAPPVLYNNILWGNSAPGTGNQVYLWDNFASPDFYYNIIQDGIGDFGFGAAVSYHGTYENNIELDPIFIDPSGSAGIQPDASSADWSVDQGSPAINNGTPIISGLVIPELDINYNDRLRNGRIDIGALEAHINKISVTGTIPADTSWVADTVEVLGDIFIPDSVTLAISPGSKVLFNGQYKIEVRGRLMAIGTKQDSIYFMSKDTTGFSNYESMDGGWWGINFDNRPEGANGAMSDNDSSIFSFCVFRYAKGYTKGGVFYAELFSKIRISNSSIENCATYNSGYGVAIYGEFSNPIIKNCIFRNNYAENGGILYFKYSDFTLINSIITENSTLNTGGSGLIFYNSAPLIDNCLIANNVSHAKTALGYAGGIYSKMSDPVITNCMIVNNYHKYYGAGIYCKDGNPVLINNLFANNRGEYSVVADVCAVYFESTEKALLINNTIVNNSRYGIGFKSSNADIYNTILWGNAMDEVFIDPEGNTFINLYNCLIDGTVDQSYFDDGYIMDYTDILDSNPGFINPSTIIGNDEYALSADWNVNQFSSVINTGILNIPDVSLPSPDLGGNPRINGSAVDIGAFEHQGGPPVITLQPIGGSRCEGELITLLVETIDSVDYQWQKDGIDIPGAIESAYMLPSVTSGDQGNYWCVVSNAYGAVTSNTATLFVNEIPEFLQEPDHLWAQVGEEVILRTYARGTSPAFQWQKDGIDIPGKVTPELNIPAVDYSDEGTYRCLISNTCGSDITDPAALYLTPQICMVTFNPATGNNLVVWEKQSSAPYDFYNIYRESNAAGIYDLMETVSYSELSVYEDTTADPTVQAYLYKITGVDDSGYETDLDLCSPHKTIHLLVSTNPELNTTQLEWDKYYGFAYQTYLIYRSPDGSGFSQIGSIASTHQSWTDPSPLADVGYYRISVEKAEDCVPTGGGKKADAGPYSHAMSNTEDNRLQDQGNQPPDTIILTNNSVDENLPVGSFVGRLETADPDTADHHVYKLAAGEGDDDNHRFTTLGDLLITAGELDYETTDTCHIRIKTTDKGDLSVEQEFMVLVIDENEDLPNEAPTDLTLSSNTITENMPPGSMVGRLWTVDPDVIDNHTYSLVEGVGSDNNDSFMIQGDMLLSAAVFDFEMQDTFRIRIRSTDQGDMTVEKPFIVTITDVDEGGVNTAPTAIMLSANTIEENRQSGTLVGAFSTNDPDPGDDHAYTLVDGLGGDDNDDFMIMGNILISGAGFDYETRDTLYVRVNSTDEGGLSFEESFIILVTDIFEAEPNLSPTDIVLSENELDENMPALTMIGRLQTDDPNMDDSHSYKLVEGDGDEDNSNFVIVEDVLFSTVIFDFETKEEYYIRIRSIDDGEGELTTEKSFTIYVNDLLEIGFNDLESGHSSLKIYPNPFTHSTMIEFPNPDNEQYRMYITDLAGKVVRIVDEIYSNQVELHRKNLPEGVYFVELRGPEIYRGKLVIE